MSNFKFLNQACEQISKSNIALFFPACPHQSISKAKKNEEDNGWMQLLEKLTLPKVGIVMDASCAIYYPWLIDSGHLYDAIGAPHHRGLIATQHVDCLKFFIYPIYDESMFPKEMPDKEDKIVSLSAFRSWKRVDESVRAWAKAQRKPRYQVFAKGMYYGKYRKTDWWQEACNLGMEYAGEKPHEECLQALVSSKGLVDLSRYEFYKKYNQNYRSYNFSVLEAMLSYAVPIVYPNTEEPGFLPREMMAVAKDEQHLSAVMENVTFDWEEWKDKVFLNKKYAEQKCGLVPATEDLIRKLQLIMSGDTSEMENWMLHFYRTADWNPIENKVKAEAKEQQTFF